MVRNSLGLKLINREALVTEAEIAGILGESDQLMPEFLVIWTTECS